MLLQSVHLTEICWGIVSEKDGGWLQNVDNSRNVEMILYDLIWLISWITINIHQKVYGANSQKVGKEGAIANKTHGVVAPPRSFPGGKNWVFPCLLMTWLFRSSLTEVIFCADLQAHFRSSLSPQRRGRGAFFWSLSSQFCRNGVGHGFGFLVRRKSFSHKSLGRAMRFFSAWCRCTFEAFLSGGFNLFFLCSPRKLGKIVILANFG